MQRRRGRDTQNVSLPRMAAAAVGYSSVVRTRRPQTRQKGVSRNEKYREQVLSTIAGSTGFTIQSTLSLNPGIAASFPRLAQIAQLWQQYRFNKLRFDWVPFNPTSTAGDVMLSPNYDASQPAPTTETQASDNVGTAIANCYIPFSCELDPSAMMGLGPRRWVRSGNIAGDIKTFDVGKLFVITNNEIGTTALGKLYVEYDVDFYLPQNSPLDYTTPAVTSFYTQNAAQTFTNGSPAALAWDTVLYDPLGFGSPSSGVFTPAAGAYRIEVQASCADSSAEAFTVKVELYKNGASLSKKCIGEFNSGVSLGAGEIASVSCLGVIPMNGTDTFQVEVTMVGSAGTLTAAAGSCQMLVNLA